TCLTCLQDSTKSLIEHPVITENNTAATPANATAAMMGGQHAAVQQTPHNIIAAHSIAMTVLLLHLSFSRDSAAVALGSLPHSCA
ncbi:hypothetical protein, partial [Anaplasma marginale]|uniref:hypothetical protein n=1 Tax=Anaplasma marginale TaxID=770 RepID=UPI001A9D9CB9